jgi:hypothetical protein
MIESVGLKGSAGIVAGLISAVSFPASALLQYRGQNWR